MLDLRYPFLEFVGVLLSWLACFTRLLVGLLYCGAIIGGTLSVGIVETPYLQPPQSTTLIKVDMGSCHT